MDIKVGFPKELIKLKDSDQIFFLEDVYKSSQIERIEKVRGKQ